MKQIVQKKFQCTPYSVASSGWLASHLVITPTNAKIIITGIILILSTIFFKIDAFCSLKTLDVSPLTNIRHPVPTSMSEIPNEWVLHSCRNYEKAYLPRKIMEINCKNGYDSANHCDAFDLAQNHKFEYLFDIFFVYSSNLKLLFSEESFGFNFVIDTV
jgi:hypothetical protein